MRQHIREAGPITVFTTLILTDDPSVKVLAHFIEWNDERHCGVNSTDLILFRLEGAA